MFVAIVSAITNVLNFAQHLAHTGNAQNSNKHTDTSYWILVMPINNLCVCVRIFLADKNLIRFSNLIICENLLNQYYFDHFDE